MDEAGERLDPADTAFPRTLLDLERAPSIWWRGLHPPGQGPAVAIVGTRHPTPYGQRVARRLAEGCARAGITVVSGLAIGIDAAAHLGALDAPGGRTVGVLAAGLDLVRASSNGALAARVEQAGSLVSAYPPGTPARKHRFLERNTVIAALAHVTVVVEGLHGSSGALSTATRARELGRPILAVPGMVTTPQAGGPNALLRDGAHPCLDVVDVLVALGLAGESPATWRLADLVDRPIGKRILETVEAGSLDAAGIAAATGFDPKDVLDELLELELAGFVRRFPTGMYGMPRD